MKKNNLKILLLLGLIIGFYSCYKDDSPSLSEDSKIDTAISSAKDFFENQFDPNNETLKNNSDWGQGNSKRHQVEKSLDWQNAYTRELEDGQTGVYVPILFFNDSSYIKGQWTSFSLSSLSYALIYEEEKGKKSVEIVTTFPNSVYLSAEEEPELFSGVVYVEDWNGKLIKSIHHINGELFLLDAKMHMKRSLTEICSEIIDWYTCGSADGGSTKFCNYSYSETVYSFCGGGTGGDGVSGSNYEPAGGGGTSTGTVPVVDCHCNVCPVCGGCLEEAYKKVPYDDGTGTTADVPVDCPTCVCVPIVDATGLEKNAKANCIYSKLINGAILKDFIARYYPSASATSPLGELNLTWTFGSTFGDSSAETFPIGIPRNGTYNSVEIRLNESSLNSSSAILVAETLLHEALHAKLIAEVYDEVGTTDFKTLYTFYLGWGKGNIDSEQEMQMMYLYTGQMAEALWAFDQTQGINNTIDFYIAALSYSFCSQLNLPITFGTEEYRVLYNATKDCN